GFHRIHYDFHGLGVTPIDSCPFLQSKKIFFAHAASAGYFLWIDQVFWGLSGTLQKLYTRGFIGENLKQDYVDPGSNKILFP
ncbi:MAG: hypothetical protein LUQ40_04375, partial [Methanomicrobiales archaeon]|nr:hypothetical protein [Methanomicrobiales archaeon]